MNLVLRHLEASDEDAFFKGMEKWKGEDPLWYSFAWKEGMTYPAMLEILKKEFLGLNLEEGRVLHSMLYGFVDGEIVGRLSVGHRLNENLLRRGGHIGYALMASLRTKLMMTMEF